MVSAPVDTSQRSLTVLYSASGANVAKVQLFAKGPTDAIYAQVAEDDSPSASGTFAYSADQGDGDYRFYSVVVDPAGNTEPAPSAADATTRLTTRTTLQAGGVDFGELTVGASSVATALRITNTGGLPLKITDVAVVGPDAHEFSLAADDCTTTQVAATPTPPSVRPERIAVTVVYGFVSRRTATRLSSFVVRNVPRGSTVAANCPRGCAKRALTRHNAVGTLSLQPLVTKPLLVGTRITVVVSKPGVVAAVKILAIRSLRPPTLTARCLPEGSARPIRCA